MVVSIGSTTGLFTGVKLMDFDIFLKLDGRSVQKVLRYVDSKTVQYAMQNTNGQMQGKIFSVMSRRCARLVKSEMAQLGQVSDQEIEAARQKMLAELERQIASGDIVHP